MSAKGDAWQVLEQLASTDLDCADAFVMFLDEWIPRTRKPTRYSLTRADILEMMAYTTQPHVCEYCTRCNCCDGDSLIGGLCQLCRS